MAWNVGSKLTRLLVDVLRSTAQTEQKADINHRRDTKNSVHLSPSIVTRRFSPCALQQDIP
ncbi:hypothetical protein V8Z74_04665 [Comamonas sp. w2-DMI]|uniref:Uncharacterized protein n=1 Tax=Comamonas terrae TaxID=673548 RepID=A0ABW5UT22_9BURK|nr:hypothetical protein [Comamonas terrae]